MKILSNKRSGFTLIEIMLVVVIIGMLAGMVGMAIVKNSKMAYVTSAKAQLSNYKQALQSYYLDNGTFPTTQQGLQALISAPSPMPPKWHGPYLDPPVLHPDPWGRDYGYEYPARQNPDTEGFDLYSAGPDGQVGTTDDIVSWK